jgi:2-oxoglutarate ferredoxin oxidoreductase subunit alpha
VKTAPDYRRYALGSAVGLSPRGVPGYGDGLVCVDSDEHDESGHIEESPAMREVMVAKRLAKIASVKKDIIAPRLYGDKNYSTLLVGWGSVKMPVIEAMQLAGKPGIAFLHFPWVYPLPEGVGDYVNAAETLVAVEGNATGQFADLVEFATGRRFDRRILKNDGYQFTIEELADRIAALPAKNGGKA